MEKYFANSTEDIVFKIKKTVLEKWKEKAEAEEKYSHEDMYNRMVDDAIRCIHYDWELSAKYSASTEAPVEMLHLQANKIFFITKERKLLSDHACVVFNPLTGRSCFYDSFTFESDEEVEKYIKDILSRLPEGTTYRRHKSRGFLSEEYNHYTFIIDISMK